MFLTPVEEKEVLDTVNKCNNKTSKDFNDLDMKTIKKVAEAIIKPFTYICNLSFKSGQFPAKMKIAKVIPIFKSGHKHLYTNYRPVSLLPQFSKILEKLFVIRVHNFIEKYNLLSDRQYGFRRNRSTSLALIDLINEITTCIDKKKYVMGIFIDLQKAFDTIDHRIVMNKLEKYGFRGIIKNWIQSYLGERQQFVQMDQYKSEQKNIICGVPQGSILGPILFLLYIIDICNVSEEMKFVLFADDTNIICSGENIEQLLEEITQGISKLKNCFNANKSLNLKKTKYILFGNRKSNVPVQLTIDNIVIEKVQQNTFLGVVLDEKISWKPHISYLQSKVAKCVGVMKRASFVLNQNALGILFHSFVRSYQLLYRGMGELL